MHSTIEFGTAARRIASTMRMAVVVLGAASAAAHADTGRCRLSLSEPAVDFGRSVVSRHGDEQAGGKGAKLGSRESTLLAVCDADRRMAIVFRARGTALDTLSLGNDGLYTVTVTRARLDGREVDVGKSTSADVIPTNTHAAVTLGNGEIVVPTDGQAMLAGKTLELTLRIDAFMRPGARLRDEAEFDEPGHFELIASPAWDGSKALKRQLPSTR